MIEEVLSEIVYAEQKAEEIITSSRERAGEMTAAAGVECARISEEALLTAKEQRERVAKQSNQKAQAEYDRILNESEVKASALIEQKKGQAVELGKQIFGRIINGNC
ncbi:MAG: hypothetical protein IJW13_02475 [Clostridia bacterium]|nr:hypothetical protein [Clostridia bacterium]